MPTEAAAAPVKAEEPIVEGPQAAEPATDEPAKSDGNDKPADVLPPVQRFGRKAKLLTALGAVLLLIGIGGLGMRFVADKPEPVADKPKATPTRLEQNRADSEKLRATQDYDGAKAVWQQTLDSKDATEEERYKAYRQKGALDETKGDYTAALVSYQEAEKLTDATWRPELEAIARCYDRLGDKPNALKYYEKVLAMYPATEQYIGDRKYYTKKVEALKQAVGAGQNG
jgi:tetratricopeptide (TPR) repeat protein